MLLTLVKNALRILNAKLPNKVQEPESHALEACPKAVATVKLQCPKEMLLGKKLLLVSIRYCIILPALRRTTLVVLITVLSSHRKETRWNTIYNVCLDLLNSPNIQTSSIKQQKPENFCTKPSAEQGDMLKQFDNGLSMIDEVRGPFTIPSTCLSYPEKSLWSQMFTLSIVGGRENIAAKKIFYSVCS